MNMRNILYFAIIIGLIIMTGFVNSWNVALGLINMCLISAIMALGVNIQWGYAGLFNVGVMGFVALGGLAAVLIGEPPVPEAWSAGGVRLLFSLILGALTIVLAIFAYRRLPAGWTRTGGVTLVLLVGFFLYRSLFDPAVAAIESVDPAATGYLGGLNFFELLREADGAQRADLFVLLAWPVGGLFAAGAAWVVGKTALGLRSDYLAIATLGIAEIIIALLKNEDWLARGVKNVNGIPRPVPYEASLQADPAFVDWATSMGGDPVTLSAIMVKLGYACLFGLVLLALIWMSEMALKSPWGRMMRAIRDNEVSARAMGKDVTARHLQIFILGSAICGIAGAMLVTLDSLLSPGTYQPLRFTFLIWVMVIVGGSGNNWGAVLGGFVIWYFWIMVEPMGLWLMQVITSGMAEGSALKAHLIASAAHMRLLTMGLILLLVLRFSPRGLIPEK